MAEKLEQHHFFPALPLSLAPLRKSLANLAAYPRTNILTHHNLMARLNAPFSTLPHPRDNPQALLAFA
jgi:hypothetical protein